MQTPQDQREKEKAFWNVNSIGETKMRLIFMTVFWLGCVASGFRPPHDVFFRTAARRKHDLSRPRCFMHKDRQEDLPSKLPENIVTRYTSFLSTHPPISDWNFTYAYDTLLVDGERAATTAATVARNAKKTTGVVMIHPIGVGIARWYYHRIMRAFGQQNYACQQNVFLVAPDLLASGTATSQAFLNASLVPPKHLPLLNISDWSEQVLDLMAEHDDDVDDWCLVANGGCSPIALQVAARQNQKGNNNAKPVRNVILSSIPRLSFFLEASNPVKVQNAHIRLTGIVGRLFWKFACRKRFLQKFSEKNLVADPANLGPDWTRNCYSTAKRDGGASRYSTFAFLAGTLQDGCVASLEGLRGSNTTNSPVHIDIIKGRDIRRNQPKSWFWQRRRRRKQQQQQQLGPRQTLSDYVRENGNGGREIVIGGRISLAHEDAYGYRDAILSFLVESH